MGSICIAKTICSTCYNYDFAFETFHYATRSGMCHLIACVGGFTVYR